MKAIILDTETTGVDDPGLVASAFMVVDHMGEQAGESSAGIWNPGRPIEPGASAVHGIIDEDVRLAPSAEHFRLPDGVTHIIGHNVDFDWRVIGEPAVRRICTLALARAQWPALGSYSLGALMFHIMPAPAARDMTRNAHSASADMLMAGHLLRAIARLRQPRDLDDLWRMSEEARVPKFMPFGKHKGMPIADVPRDYKAWLLRQDDIDPYLAKALQQ